MPVMQHHMLVQQHAHSKSAQFIDPGMRTGVILVIPGHHESAMASPQIGQRCDVLAQFRHRTVDQVTGDGHQIGIQAVDLVDDALDVGALDGRPDMKIAELRNRETLQRNRQMRDRHLYMPDSRRATRIEKTDQRDGRGQQWHSGSSP